MKVLIWGINNIRLRRKIEFYCDENVNIIGYTDGIFKKDIIDNQPFYDCETINEIEFDRIIIASIITDSIRQIKDKLYGLGIGEDKIVVPVLFDKYPDRHHWYNPIEDMESEGLRHGQDVDIIMLGDCSAFWNFDDSIMRDNYYKLTSTSGDIYYSYLLLNELVKQQLFPNVKKIFFCAGYRIFGVDMSKAELPFQTDDMILYLELNDYHNYNKSNSSLIKNYVDNYRIWGSKLKKYYHVGRSYQLLLGSDLTFADKDYSNPMGWNKYLDTINENEEYFEKLISCAMSINSDMEFIFIIPPFYQGNINDECMKNIQKTKTYYYDQVKKYKDKGFNVRVYDYFNLFANDLSYFCDNIHINFVGARKFTQYILEKTDLLY